MSTASCTAGTGPAPDFAPAGSLVESLAADMVSRWHRGERPAVEEYLARHPELREAPAAALELLAEELALRDEFGEPAAPDELARRFPQWPAQVRALIQCQRVLGGSAPRFPVPGDRLGEFALVAEIGRGAHGRAYLAAQPALGGRRVVLKVAPAGGHEHVTLARLQHTHVVPLFSAHDFPDRGLRALCQPDFGGASLADVLARFARGERPGAWPELAATLRPAGADERRACAAPPGCEPFERAACWAGACLADALQYAHDRGLLHLDVKPSNVLIAADGSPMLLDFHLARPPLPAGEGSAAWLGGTPGYMAPEQAAALQAVREGRPVPEAVDGRADVFALGTVLAEMLRALAVGSRVSRGLADVLARSTAARPGDRYPTAAAFAEDLRRHLADEPLAGAPNRSLRERWAKWRRRRPLALPLLLLAAALVAGAGGAAARVESQKRRAEVSLRDGEAALAAGRAAEAAEAFRGGEALVAGLPVAGDLAARLRDGRRAAERERCAAELHAVCEGVRPLYGAEVVAPEQARAAADLCRALWARRDAFASRLGASPGARAEWRDDLRDAAILLARLAPVAESGERRARAHREALGILTEAEALFGPAAALDFERAAHARALGLAAEADAALRRARGREPRGAWEWAAVGREALARGDLDSAAAALDRARELDPQDFWACYHCGECRLRRGDAAGALAAFSACAALAPRSAWCRYNRGLAFAELGRPDAAGADFDGALALDPNFGAAFVARAGLRHRAGRYAEALADLDRAAARGVPAPAVNYQRAVVQLARRDRAAAVASLRACLAADPNHRPARELLASVATQGPGAR